MFDFNESVKETTTKQNYTVKIHDNNIISKIEYVPEHDAIDITFENEDENFMYRERFFNPAVNVPNWTDPETEIRKFQSKLKHILKRFIPEEETIFKADSFEDLANILNVKLENAIQNKTPFKLKLIFNKDLTYPELPKNGRFMAVEGEPELKYSKWELENRMIQEVSEEVENASVEDEKYF